MARKIITLEIDAEDEDLLRGLCRLPRRDEGPRRDRPGRLGPRRLRGGRHRAGPRAPAPAPPAGRPGPRSTPPKKGAPLRRCPCGQARENRGVASRDVFTCLGPIGLRRRWWGSRCPCAPGGYHADAVLGLDGGLSPRLQRKACRLAADLSFDRTPRAPPRVARRLPGERDPAGLLRAAGGPGRPLAGPGDGLGRGLPSRPRGAGSSPSTPARSTPARRAGAT